MHEGSQLSSRVYRYPCTYRSKTPYNRTHIRVYIKVEIDTLSELRDHIGHLTTQSKTTTHKN